MGCGSPGIAAMKAELEKTPDFARGFDVLGRVAFENGRFVIAQEAFKRALLAAKSVVRSREGTSGLYLETLLKRLGIAEAMRGKIVLGGSGRIAELVGRGEASMAVQQIPELLPVDGVEFAGPLPDELQLYTVFSAGIGAASNAKDVANAFVDALIAPAAAALFKAKGLEPILR